MRKNKSFTGFEADVSSVSKETISEVTGKTEIYVGYNTDSEETETKK